MPVQITCVVASLGNVKVPELDLQEIRRDFLEASDSQIELSFDVHGPVTNVGLFDPNTIEAVELALATEQITGNPRDAGPVNRIALIFSPSYAAVPAAFGVMFDRGFHSSAAPDPDGRFTAVPREGCAVFSTTIGERRGEGESVRRELQFTVGHELGHVFNLQHQASPPSYLFESANVSGPPGPEFFGFSEGQRRFLSRIENRSTNPVMPGGRTFEDTGFFNRPNRPSEQSEAELPELEVEIAMPPEFCFFEPVELDLTVRCRNNGSNPIVVPNVFDPGFTGTRISIKEPTGEVRLYRSTKAYCGPGNAVAISKRKPYQRDISLFGQSGGYTFRMSGPHDIWMDIALPGHGLITSNRLEVHLLAEPRAKGARSAYERKRKLLTSAAPILYYRNAECARANLTKLTEYYQRYAGSSIAANCCYTLGRVYHREAILGCPSWRKRFSKRAKTLLKRATQSDQLGEHRRRRAAQFLETI